MRWKILLNLLLLLSVFTACQREDKISFVLVPKSISNPYWFHVENGMKAAAKELNIECQFLGPVQAADVSAQVDILESLIARRVHGIAISPNDPDGVTPSINRAIKSGIPVITFDSDAPKSDRLCYIGTDNYLAGQLAARQLIKHEGKQGEYAIMTGGLGALNLNERIRGFRDEFLKQDLTFREINILACDDDTDKALMQMEDFTRSNPELDAWFITGCWPTVAPQGAFLNALNQRKDLTVIGFDIVQEQLLLIKDGLVQTLIGQRPYEMGYKSVHTLYNIVVNNQPVEKMIVDTGVDIVDSSNLDRFLKK